MSFVGSFAATSDVAETTKVGWILWIAVAAVGAEVLLVYNGILTAQGFFDEVFPDLGFAFSSMIAYSLPMSVTQLFLIFKSESFSLAGRMRFGFAGVVLSCVLLVVTVMVGDAGQKNFWNAFCLCDIVLMSVTSATMQSALMGFCAKVSAQLSVAAMFGFGVSGILTFGISELCIGLRLELKTSTAILFGICTVFTVFTFFVWERMVLRSQARDALLNVEKSQQDSEVSQTPEVEAGETYVEATNLSTTRVLRTILPQAINVFVTFGISLSMFPGVCVQWQVGGSTMTQASFVTLIIGMFQVFDVMGRYTAGLMARFIPPKCLVIFVLMRLVFIPLFMMGQRAPETFWLWGSIAGRCLLMAVFAATNGFVGSCAMMFGPGLVSEANRTTAGIAMSCFMVSGLFAGTLLAPLSQTGIGKA